MTEQQTDVALPEDVTLPEQDQPEQPKQQEQEQEQTGQQDESEPSDQSEQLDQPAPAVPPLPAEAPAPKPSRKPFLWALARWTAAVLVCGGVGAGTALGITSMERTDVPGLETENDGRWEYPKLSLPALPADAPRPFSEGNDGEVHHADLRKYLLPAPAGATPDPKLNGGWVTVEQFLSQYRKDDRAELSEALKESALRHVAARGWTTPDGTTTRIHLLRFNSVAFAEAFKDDAVQAGSVDGPLLDGVEGVQSDSDVTIDIRVPYTALYSFVELPQNADQTRWAYIQAGDTLALITQSREGEAVPVPFQQTVALQNQLLG
ncbi:hypothetical protein M5362_27915 [Streptomyces sp. Je 1-79]|uniref:hypothetical protein n=1 Tax=Streptomyces sp. Je 1-79 TaxID=2943847 RepID=UPI0021A86859|nr:hypothetical protein [Streptomyces sp. Je 1-79]MCT4356951.1 hypothetical protein [Streptomyces sp. Je 1-79]